MKILEIRDFILKEFSGWGKFERFLLPGVIALIAVIAIYLKDSPVALCSAICGICATILAGKGKISCYIFGMIANICYSYISYKNHFWGNLFLNMLYYFPMQFVGISKWKNHLKKDTQEIYKTKLSRKERINFIAASLVCSLVLFVVLKQFHDLNPATDAFMTVLSIVGFILTVKRCIEQWYIWTVVNTLGVIMWIYAYINHSQCFATILMWFTYLILGIYFLKCWLKELKQSEN